MFTTSYKSEGLAELLTALVRSVGAKKVIEFGTQQGHSSILLAKGEASVITYDSFEENYSNYPQKETHSNLAKALKNTSKYNIKVCVKDVFNIKPVTCDVLHVDICNHQNNVAPLLENWKDKVKKMIILEGGVLNKWQKKYGFDPYCPYVVDEWDSIVIKGKGGYAMTILTRS